MPRVAALVLLLLASALSSSGAAGAATRPVPFVPMVAPAIGTCAAGGAAVRLLVARDAPSRTQAASCLGGVAPSGRVLVVLAPDSAAAGTTVEIRRVEVVGGRGHRVLRVTAAIAAPAGEALLAQIVTTPRAVVRLGAGALPSRWIVVDQAGHVLARGSA